MSMIVSLAFDADATMKSSRSQGSLSQDQDEPPRIGCMLLRTDNKMNISRLVNDVPPPNPTGRQLSEIDMMKEKFSKLLLGEDMSGGGKGVSSALALSNAITNLAASAFGEQRKLEPMSAETKAKWQKEIDWLISVTDHIVEFVPSKQKAKDGSNMEIMVTKQRRDLHMNIPTLKKLDAMLFECLDNFKDQTEFSYVSREEEENKGKNVRADNKWWIPTPKVPPNGLPEATRKWLQFQKDSVNQVLKAAMAINAHVLSEMEIPESYIDSLPKNGRASLGDSMYKSITDEFFDPDYFLSSVDLSSEHKVLDLKNKIEASVVIWERKMNGKEHNKSSWGSSVKFEKRELLEDRGETILLVLKHRFPGLPQSDLDISKIQCSRDVGHAVLESYSRIIESRAFSVLSRIDDVMNVDAEARNQSSIETREITPMISPDDDEDSSENETRLSDFMGWNLENAAEMDMGKKDPQDRILNKLQAYNNTNRKAAYIDRLEDLGCTRSPVAYH